MKRIGTIFLCLVILFCMTAPYAAAETPDAQTRILDLGDGFTVEEATTIFASARSSTTTAQRSFDVKSGDTVIAEITIKGTFRYDGSSVSVVSKELTKCETYDGWSFSSSSLTSSGGTITFSGTLKKGLWSSKSITLPLSCDKDGNIS